MKSNIDLFREYYSIVSEKINKELKKYNNNLINEENEILKRNLDILANLNSNGKLIRGMLINLGYKLTNPDDIYYSINLSIAYEVFQTSILVHDDIIDKDNLRRGKDTIHYYNYKYYSNISNDDVNHLSNSVALCMGDYGLYLANQVISESYRNDKKLGDLLIYFNDIVLKTIKGELIDTVLPFESKNNIVKGDLEEDILLIYKLKTAYYTITGPLCLGMILGNSSKEKIEDITRFGDNIGIAFQIQDDILGIYSDNMGKVIGSDIKEFKQTIMYSYIDKYKKEYKEELLRYYGNDLSSNSIQRVRELFNDSGAKDYAINMMNKLYDEAINILNSINWLKEDDKKILYGLIEYLRKRNK